MPAHSSKITCCSRDTAACGLWERKPPEREPETATGAHSKLVLRLDSSPRLFKKKIFSQVLYGLTADIAVVHSQMQFFSFRIPWQGPFAKERISDSSLPNNRTWKDPKLELSVSPNARLRLTRTNGDVTRRQTPSMPPVQKAYSS
jgi:hypothetical protein